MDVETLIIGAGSAGLAVARRLDHLNRDYLVVDKEPQVGRNWRNAYERLHLHTPRSRSGLPHQPMPASYPRYPSRLQMLAYLEDYAKALKHPPQMNTEVLAVEHDGGSWISQVGDGRVRSRNVVVATGLARVPAIPHFEGETEFGGPIPHSPRYRSGASFRGQRVLVVGFGNSAGEIALDLHEQGAYPTLAVRGAVNVIPRDLLGIPIVRVGLVTRLFSPKVADAINAPVLSLAVGDIEAVGLRKLAYGPVEQIRVYQQMPLMDVGTMGLIRSGAIAVRSGVARFTANGIEFVDGSVEPFDAVVLGTGNRPALGSLLGAFPGGRGAGGAPGGSGGVTAMPGLYFCGYTVASGGDLHEVGRGSRRIVTLIARCPCPKLSAEYV